MKRINKFALFILGALSFASCSDINDIESEGYRITGEQIDDATSVIPSRVEAKIAGMYSSMGTVCAAFPSETRDDDGGYPTVCLSQDFHGPDMICANNGYNWFSVSSEYSDRYATYANPFARYAIFYNQIKAANDIILSIDPATASETEKSYLGQAKAVRAFDYLCLAPYYQFRYATSKDLPCVPLITSPANTYGQHKLEAEERVLALCPEAVLLRAPWMYDLPGDGLPLRGNLPLNLLQAAQNGTPVRFSPHDHRGVSWVREVVEHLFPALQLPGGVYNFGSGNDADMVTTARQFAEALGVRVQIEPADFFRNLVMDSSKLAAQGIRFHDTLSSFEGCLRRIKPLSRADARQLP